MLQLEAHVRQGLERANADRVEADIRAAALRTRVTTLREELQEARSAVAGHVEECEALQKRIPGLSEEAAVVRDICAARKRSIAIAHHEQQGLLTRASDSRGRVEALQAEVSEMSSSSSSIAGRVSAFQLRQRLNAAAVWRERCNEQLAEARECHAAQVSRNQILRSELQEAEQRLSAPAEEVCGRRRLDNLGSENFADASSDEEEGRKIKEARPSRRGSVSVPVLNLSKALAGCGNVTEPALASASEHIGMDDSITPEVLQLQAQRMELDQQISQLEEIQQRLATISTALGGARQTVRQDTAHSASARCAYLADMIDISLTPLLHTLLHNPQRREPTVAALGDQLAEIAGIAGLEHRAQAAF